MSKNINSKHFNFTLSALPHTKNGKTVYASSSDVCSFFAEKQIQKNIKYTYSVKQADRDLIIPQIRSVLSNEFPKFIIKTDIKSFYEKIDRNLLIKKLNQNPILSLSTRKLIAKLLRAYDHITGQSKGIPRGIGISAYLSELYLKDFDRKIKKLPSLVYYSRYVDDIVIVFSLRPGDTATKHLSEIENFARSELLSLNEIKTKKITYEGKSSNFNFEYLGYNFNKSGSNLSIGISNKRLQKYNDRIKLTIDRYLKNSKKQPKRAMKELLMRIKFLTSNTKLSNNKGNAIVGVYNSNKWVTNYSFLTSLNKSLKSKQNRFQTSHSKKKL